MKINVKLSDFAKEIYQNNGLEYKTKGSSGFDVRAIAVNNEKISQNPIEIPPQTAKIIQTGLFFEIPNGFEIQVRSRSGLAAKNNVFVLNSPGTIDADYTGEVCVILYNLGSESFFVNLGDRIAQCVLSKVEQTEFDFVSEIHSTERGSDGFGSTGVK